MNILLAILGIIGGLIALLLLIALFTKKSYTISREFLIEKPVREVFTYIKHLKNQDHYSKGVMTDPNMKKQYRGMDGTPGFIYSWDGNKQAGKGEQEIKKIIEDKKLDVEIRFIRPFEGIAQAPLKTQSLSSNQTRVTWGMSSSMKYPMNIMLMFIDMNKLLGKDLDESLRNLKSILERK